MVQISAKSAKLFRTFNLVVTEFKFLSSVLGYFLLNFLAKSTKPFRIFRKMNYLNFDFNLGIKVGIKVT